MTLDGILAAQLFDELGDVDKAHESVPVKQTNGLFHASAVIFEPIDKAKQAFIAGLRETHSINPDHIKKNKHGQLHKKFDTSLTNVMNSYPVYTAERKLKLPILLLNNRFFRLSVTCRPC